MIVLCAGADGAVVRISPASGTVAPLSSTTVQVTITAPAPGGEGPVECELQVAVAHGPSRPVLVRGVPF